MIQHRSVRLVAVIAAAIVALVALLTVAPAASANSTKLVTVPGKVTIGVGEAVKVRLATNPSTGYTWMATVTGDKAAIALSPGVYKTTAQIGLPGAGGVTEWTITGKAAGKAKITFASIPPSGGTSPYQVALGVTVR